MKRRFRVSGKLREVLKVEMSVDLARSNEILS
jgi:hypothetical protein